LKHKQKQRNVVSMDTNEQLAHIRHSLSHLLAMAALEHDPKAQLGIGPVIDNGFYYDIKFSTPLSDEHLPKLEARMRELAKENLPFTGIAVSADEARAQFAAQPFKLELINELSEKGEALTFYKTGEQFIDLCRGGHVATTNEIPADAFCLSHLAGAYWRGDEKNEMLTRVYGLAFMSKDELDTYKLQQEEAKKRDHRKLGKEMGLFTFSDLVGSGMPLWTPRGNIVRNAVINYSRELNAKLGFGEVHTPNVNKAELFKISGHYDQYKEDMLKVSSQYVEDEMFLKPMNCPQHTQIYAAEQHSYRELPIRYSDFANLYRDERPGELSGLTRLRCFAQDDGHIFCREQQIEQEIGNVLAAIEEALTTYGISYWMRLSLRDPQNKEKYLGGDETWNRAESILRKLLIERNIEMKEAEGEAAFYGPKIDIMAVDALGRQWQISTVQLDFSMPERFDLFCINEKGEKERVVMIHRALIGSPDRFLGILIEHFGGHFPLWLSPEQVRIVPVTDVHMDYARGVLTQLKDASLRAELDDSNESMGKKIRVAKTDRVPYFLVIGDQEVTAGTVTVEHNVKGKIGVVSVAEFVASAVKEVRERAR
jgi:threonyl-tRNA synthetase